MRRRRQQLKIIVGKVHATRHVLHIYATGAWHPRPRLKSGKFHPTSYILCGQCKGRGHFTLFLNRVNWDDRCNHAGPE